MMREDTSVDIENMLIIRSDTPDKASAHIYKTPLKSKYIFMCGDFTPEELIEVINKHREFNGIAKDSAFKKFFNKLFS